MKFVNYLIDLLYVRRREALNMSPNELCRLFCRWEEYTLIWSSRCSKEVNYFKSITIHVYVYHLDGKANIYEILSLFVLTSYSTKAQKL